ncbi:MAK10 [Candida pseudojiufengensis]|uniref:MAK10 n=1 Tax=Candida pseudojiufengensis TaxID=497109 RepID=UPI0022245D92|nr:MAK10 [Candida pseudojiufengensis]KAI5967019.1 MAK10 [Candida pseudojiufengensis]
MSILDINEFNEELIDITSEVFDSLQHLQDNKVVKSSLFELLEGTRALEVLNSKLDTGLIELEDEEINFDCSKPQSSTVVINIQNKLLQFLVNWLESDSLPVTVLSCRYVQCMLENYLIKQNSIWEQCSFNQPKLSKVEYEKNTNYWLIHKVLKIFIMGLCKFIGFTINIAKTFLYEEEDLTTRNMNFNYLFDVPTQFIIERINVTIEWIISNEIENSDILIAQLKIISSLNQFEASVTSQDINFMKDTEKKEHLFQFCKDVEKDISVLKKFEYNESKIPIGVFSKFIQIEMDNSSIPTGLPETNFTSTLEHVRNIFEITYKFVNQANNIKSMIQLEDYLQFNIKFPITKFSVFSRGFFQLFFIRDDKSIFGSKDIDLTRLCLNIVGNIVGINSILLGPLETQLSQVKESTRQEILTQRANFILDLESAIYNNLCIYGANPCRSQQLISRGLIIWDTLQVGWENFELSMFQNFNVGDQLINEEPALSVTSYIFYQKIDMMIKLLLGGFELEIYKSFELFLIYWYANILLDNLLDHLQNRVKQIILAKKFDIEERLPKKIKKLKAGPKKEMLKSQLQHSRNFHLPGLIETFQYQEYMVESFQNLKLLINCYIKYCTVLARLQLIDFSKGPIHNLTSMENLYYLRMKPWSSIGIPQFPRYEDYSKALVVTKPIKDGHVNLIKSFEILTSIKNDLKTVDKLIQSSFNFIERKPNNFVKDSLIADWYEQLSDTSKDLDEKVSKIGKILSENKDDLTQIPNNYKSIIGKGKHKYFINIDIAPK